MPEDFLVGKTSPRHSLCAVLLKTNTVSGAETKDLESGEQPLPVVSVLEKNAGTGKPVQLEVGILEDVTYDELFIELPESLRSIDVHGHRR